MLERRLLAHATGRGSNLLAVVAAAGIGWRLVRTWRGTRHDERALKRQHGARPLCPVCTPGAGGWPLAAGSMWAPTAREPRGDRCRPCRGRLVHVSPRNARPHWRHLPPPRLARIHRN